ncbi:MAG: 2-phosphosulfolactate phosphatase [Chitinophagaceae bacterium]
MNQKPTLEVCLSPSLLPLFELKDRVVVIIDVLRATSTICTALYHGAESVIPVSSVEECIALGKTNGYITAGERDGKIAEGLQHGNSPFEYPREFVSGRKLVLTTTNGTKLLHMAKDALQIVTGSFPNLSAVIDFLLHQDHPVVLGCAGWKNRINMEDTLFAGALIHRVRSRYQISCDSALGAETLYQLTRNDLFGFMKQASHFQRLASFGLEKDIQYCLTPDLANVLPVFREGELTIQ